MNDSLTAFGEFLLRLHSNSGKRFQQTDGFTSYYAGAEANVCVLLARLGIKAEYVSRVPDNDLATAGLQQLSAHGVGTKHIVYGGEKLGLYFTEAGNQVRPTRVIYDRKGSAYAELQSGDINWEVVLHEQQYFHWSGVAAALSESAGIVCKEAIEVARKKGITISADFNYRATLWKYGKQPKEVMPALLKHSNIAVADLDAVKIYYGIETDPALSLEERFQQTFIALKPHMPQLKTLAMSFRKPGGIYCAAIAHEDKYYYSEGFSLQHITDQIGTGDAFTAGILFGLMNKYPAQQIINFATACGALKQSIPGDWAIVSKKEIEEMMVNGVSGRVTR